MNASRSKLCAALMVAAAFCLAPFAAGQQVASLQSANGDYLTAVSGGLSGTQANCGPSEFALHTNSATAGAWETFTVKWIGNNQIALMTADGTHYVSAVGGGGLGSVNDGQSIHTNATTVGPDELFTLTFSNNYSNVTIQTADGHYITAVGGGGCGGPNTEPIHTDATSVGAWETFTFYFQPGTTPIQPPITPPSNLPSNAPASYQLIVPLAEQQMYNWCWAASGKMIMEYDDPLPPVQQWAEANAAFGRMDCQQELVGYPPPNYVTPLPCDQGDGGQNAQYPFDSFGVWAPGGGMPAPLTWDQIRYQIWVMNHPVVFGWSWVGGGSHVMVLTGYSTDAQGGQWVYVNNPDASAGEIMTYDEWVSDTSQGDPFGAHTHEGDWFDFTYNGYRLIYNVATNTTVSMNPITAAQAPTLSGTVASDRVVPFSITSGGKTISGTIQERVLQETGSQTLDFYYAITNSPTSSGAVTGLTVQSFTGFAVAGGYRTDGLGTVSAESASRDVAGSTVQIKLEAIAPGSSSNFILLMTNAKTSSDQGTLTISSSQGQTQLATDQPTS